MPLLPWAIALLAGLGCFLSSWIVLPAPTSFLLPLGVGAPEVSPFLLLGNGLMVAIGLGLVRPGPLRFVVLALGVTGVVFSSLPLLQIPSTVQRAESQMQSALGHDYAHERPTLQSPFGRPRPFQWVDLIRGLPNLPLVPEHHLFATPDGVPLGLDIYQPPPGTQSSNRHATLVTLYGGAWSQGEPAATARFSRYMAAQGYTVVAIAYRHAPQYQFPAQLEDVRTALEWIRDHAATYRLTPDRLALVGWSAGAHLALLAAYQPDALPVKAVVNYYGPVNLIEGYHQPPVPDPIHTRAVLEAFLGGTPTEWPDRYRQASPIHHLRPGLPPTLLIYGQRDHLVEPRYGDQLYNGLKTHGNQAALIALPWAEHAFDAIFRGPGNQIALYYVERFLAHVLPSAIPQVEGG